MTSRLLDLAAIAAGTLIGIFPYVLYRYLNRVKSEK